MTVFLIPNPTKDSGLAVTRRAADLLHAAGAEVLLPAEFSGAELPAYVRCLPTEQAYEAADRAVTVGGDGTLLRAGLACVAHSLPVLGINLGRMGFLATCELDEMPDKLRCLAAGDHSIAARGLLAAQVPAHNWYAEAINDVVVFGRTRLHPMDYRVLCDGAPIGRYRSDGLIISTPTGSTAYSYSAGGPVLDAEASVMLLTPVCPHGAHAAPLVLNAGRVLELTADEENRSLCYACADSADECDLEPGTTLRITAAPQPLRLITFERAEQFSALATKLMRR